MNDEEKKLSTTWLAARRQLGELILSFIKNVVSIFQSMSVFMFRIVMMFRRT
jgi:hypothetical protein